MDVKELNDDGAEPKGPRTLPAGYRIGTYEIVEPVGHGGMGVVYRAKDRSLERDVALKILMPALANDAEFEKRFVREARAAAKLDHPGIVQTYSAGRSESLLFIAMQFIRGRTLYDLQKERGRFETNEALGMIRQAAEALQAAHATGLVHRDVKPNNIMVDENGRVKVMDFGLMRSGLTRDHITQTGVFYGTPEYASPEQCETAQLDGRSDIYSLGAVLYEMLTGRLPHVAETPLALFKKISEEAPERPRRLNPAIPPAAERILDRMMAKRREDRYADCAALMADLDAVLAGRAPVGATAPARSGRPLALAALAASIFIAALVAAFAVTGPMSKQRANGSSAGSGATPVSAPAVSMVVFDFKNGTGQADAAWYEIALSDLLITSLVQRPGLSLPTRDQMLWKAKDLSLGDRVSSEHQKRLLEEFRADYYVSGTYYAKAPNLRVTLACYRRADNQLAFDPMSISGTEAEVFAMVDKMSASIVERLESKLNAPTAVLSSSLVPTAELAAAPLRRASFAADAKTKAVERKDLREKRDAHASGGRARATPVPAAAPAPGSDPRPEDRLEGELKKDDWEKAPDKAKVQHAIEKLEAARKAAPTNLEVVRQWYQNRQIVEKNVADPEDLARFVANLRDQIAVSGEDAAKLELNLRNFQRCLGESNQAQRAWSAAPAAGGRTLDYFCADCEEATQATPGTCWACGAPLTLRITYRIAGGEKR